MSKVVLCDFLYQIYRAVLESPHESPELQLQLQWVELERFYAIRVICVRNGSVEVFSSSWKHKYLKVLDLLDFEKRSR